MTLSVRTCKQVWGLFAGRCAICKTPLIEDGGSGGSASLVGEIAHMAGEKPRSARYDPAMSEAAKNSPDNLMLLCRKHHKIVDDDQAGFPLERLAELRMEYLDWLNSQLQPATPWRLHVSAFTYLNVPRLTEFASMEGFHIRSPALQAGQSLHDLGFELNTVMHDFRRPLESMSIKSVDIGEVGFAHEGYVGQTLRFERLRFRTKNIPMQMTGVLAKPFTGDPATDPHIYHKREGWTLVLNIDPRWITTTTAFTLFRPSGGVSIFTGFARIHSVDFENARMIGTALAIGTPQPLVSLPPGALQGAEDGQGDVGLDHLEDAATRSRRDVWHGDLPHCEFCGRLFAGERYMVDGPMRPGGPWGCMCEPCYSKQRLPLGVGKGQLYRWSRGRWRMVGGYPLRTAAEDL